MELLDRKSLFNTINNTSEAFLFDRTIDDGERKQIAQFIASRRNLPGAYAGTFAPTESDMKSDFVLLTGEKITTRVGKAHVAGEEASRILRKLNIDEGSISESLKLADASLKNAIEAITEKAIYETGFYCCRNCSCGLWLNLSSGAFGEDGEKMLKAGINGLKSYRENGKWKGFPFFYMLNALNEIDVEAANEEIRYALPTIEKYLKRNKTSPDAIAARRKRVCEIAMEKAG